MLAWFDKLTTNGTSSPRTGQANHERDKIHERGDRLTDGNLYTINPVRPELVEGEGNFFNIRLLDFTGPWFDRLTTNGTSSPRTGQAHHERDRLTTNGTG